ncbi:hypothetical protein GCM10028807_24540 [Spirosoma daeguense]
MSKQLLLSIYLFLFSTQLLAQVGIGTETPASSAMLDVTSTTKGFLPPRVASTNDVPSPAEGLMVYQTGGTSGYYLFKQGSWKRLITEDEVISTVNAAVASATAPLSASIAALIEATAPVSAFAAGSAFQNVFPNSDYSFPNNQNVTGGITIGNGSSTFTFARSGTYIITYTINTGYPFQLTAGAYLDGLPISYGAAGPAVGTLTTSFAVTLSAGAVLTIRNTSIFILNPPSANINIVRV